MVEEALQGKSLIISLFIMIDRMTADYSGQNIYYIRCLDVEII